MLAWLLGAVVFALLVGAVVLNALAGDHGEPLWQLAVAVTAVIANVSIGLLLTLRRGSHPIGWLLLANGVILASFGLSEGYSAYAVLEEPDALPAPEWAVLWEQSSWPLLFAILTAIVFIFPDGRMPSRRARRVAIVSAGAFAVFLVLNFFDSEPFEPPFAALDRPLPALPEGAGFLVPVTLIGILYGLVGAARAARVRYRGADGTERLQLKWLALTGTLVPLTLAICFVGGIFVEGISEADVFEAFFFLTLGAIPASIGIAVLRYRLYDIDRVINRTLVYGVLTVLLGATYAVATLLLGTALSGDSAWVTAGATLLVAAAFGPSRSRVQDQVDRRFSRAKYDGVRRIRSFLEELRAGARAPEQVEPLLREVLSDAALQLHFWLPESEVYVDARGRAVTDEPGDGRVRTPITRAGAALGMVVHQPLAESPDVLQDVVEAAGLAIEIARLRVELRRQLEQVEASRARIVAAGYQERRRLERDLHDGAQQRLISIGLALRHAQHQLDSPEHPSSRVLDSAVDEIDVTLEELRELARGVRPSQLDHGLGPALRDLAARAPLAVEVNADGERLPSDIETAAYFIASEGLTNAVKHAHASLVRISAQRHNGTLVVTVSDDGTGGARPTAGSGLPGLADRIEAHRGTLHVHSETGKGTTLVAELPCGS
jgi:signal transduction histidine kinase